YLATEKIPVLAQDLLDVCPRKVFFFPVTGKVLVKRLSQLPNDTVASREREYAKRLRNTPVGGEIELFE
ncbi:MAG: hypothetical protein RBS57_21415, partial [Desulforhabdus sp.]|nr:hypothetical protein [Desulforhabdus sp.]